MSYWWDIQVDGESHETTASHIKTAVYRVLSHHPLPPIGEPVIIKVWRKGKTTPKPRKRPL